MRALWFCVALMPVLAQADIYRWTDAQGKVHFSATPRHATPRHATPPAGAQRVEVRPQVVERDAATRQREQRTQEYFDARREERTAAAERAGQRQAALAEECGRLRQQLSQLERGGRFYRQDAGGGPVYLSDAELDAIRRELASRESERCR
ncbi:DUF4124 domain-containing protein [Pseudomonas aeruginosa]|nr:DUF4124 domain-containing protein [Pseudomonas aeruginosa]MCS8453678.1 DUF4124 domain-containing protein [Pseudomonas aeruginosa]MCS9274390.1 DUF4124 domain-containing protein [Pseudomonas aeruginosa]MCS9589584.1 DUF4124 domain-containing protein [Pseudomonas aeruginosa]MCS9775092.1 DUF4124 domain-containing protein [Pseudomonas aeruginosa]